MEALTRAFVAVPCGEPLARELSRRLDASFAGPAGPPPVRWTHPRTWHLTLQFLGDWPRGRLRALQEALGRVAGPEPVDLVPAGLGGFPDLRRPRVLFLQFTGAGPLVELAAEVHRISGTVWPEGPQDTRPVHPHLTLTRIRDPLEDAQINLLRGIDLTDLPPVPLDGFRLYASTLGPQGARHAELAAYALRKKGE